MRDGDGVCRWMHSMGDKTLHIYPGTFTSISTSACFSFRVCTCVYTDILAFVNFVFVGHVSCMSLRR